MVINFHKISPIIKFVLAVACLSHIGINAYNTLYPEIPSLKVYEKELGNIDFPVSFKLCVREISNITKRYKNYGYDEPFDFFLGIRFFEESYYVGWNGDFVNGSSGHVKGTLLSLSDFN